MTCFNKYNKRHARNFPECLHKPHRGEVWGGGVVNLPECLY